VQFLAILIHDLKKVGGVLGPHANEDLQTTRGGGFAEDRVRQCGAEVGFSWCFEVLSFAVHPARLSEVVILWGGSGGTWSGESYPEWDYII